MLVKQDTSGNQVQANLLVHNSHLTYKADAQSPAGLVGRKEEAHIC